MKKIIGYSIFAIFFAALIAVVAIVTSAKWWELVLVFGGVGLIVIILDFAVKLILSDEN